jgi:hypothetical protein
VGAADCFEAGLGTLGDWPSVEAGVIAKLDAVLRRADPNGNPLPLDLTAIEETHRLLLRLFEMPEHLVDPPAFALRVYHHYRARNPSEVLLLNSFFLDDLARRSWHG